ncbi:MAG: HNH endonuclease, partial [Pseudomonadales bacterium]|nr:HNH endonuclease [Pseudomonadales bacterium]
FAPSRFIGYANNTIDKHEANHSKDGRETTPKISKLLGKDCVFDEELEKSYREFCQALGFEANDTGAFGVKRKYWVL